MCEAPAFRKSAALSLVTPPPSCRPPGYAMRASKAAYLQRFHRAHTQQARGSATEPAAVFLRMLAKVQRGLDQ